MHIPSLTLYIYLSLSLILPRAHFAENTIYLAPLDKRYPKFAIVKKDHLDLLSIGSQLKNLLLMCNFVTWAAEHEFPKGVVSGILGLRFDLWAQKQAMILQHITSLCKNSGNIPICNINPKVTIPNIKPGQSAVASGIPPNVVDLRRERIYSIDPLTARDLDDALSITKISDTEYKVGVHIAGVSRIVAEDSAVDKDARLRGTSVYTIDSVEHMLDPSLSQGLASLLPGLERFSLSCFWVMDDSANVKQGSVEFVESVIVSCCKLDYDTVQCVLDSQPLPGPEPTVVNGFSFEEIKKDVIIFDGLAQILRRVSDFFPASFFSLPSSGCRQC